MFSKSKKKRKESANEGFFKYLRSKTFQRLLILTITVLTVFIAIESGAAPKKYKLEEGQKSEYDISAPRDKENVYKTLEKAEEEAAKIKPVMRNIAFAEIEILNSADDFYYIVNHYSNELRNSITNKGYNLNQIDTSSSKFKEIYEPIEKDFIIELNKLNITLNNNQRLYLLIEVNYEEINEFKNITNRDILKNLISNDITSENIRLQYIKADDMLNNMDIPDEFKAIGSILVRSVLKPNKYIDNEETEVQRNNLIEYIKEKEKVMILKDERIISRGDIVTKDKLQVLNELNLLETTGKFDYVFALGIFGTILLLSLIVIFYLRMFCKKVYYDINYCILLSVIIILTTLISRFISGFTEYSFLAIPIFIAPMLITIFIDTKLAIIVNFALVFSIGFLTHGDLNFLYMSLISGTFAAFFLNKASQRSKISLIGFIIGIINVIVITWFGLIYQSTFKIIFEKSIYVFLNGILSIVLTIGMLPFLESIFNIVTPLKLLELADPNQPLIRRLLMEAPGTYHHSLMVGNLAEVATEAIGGNPLLARVGAYFHDIGKLKRPNFFKENQMSDNPHDKMTPNLSTLVITSHTKDGEELAVKHKLPREIIDIITQHHGRTLVAYFYHKAIKGEKGNEVKESNFRYEGPRPKSKEAAVVMLADSVEAAVRASTEKTEGKIEGIIRKIIKDKLDDGQLDKCDLTLKDLDSVAKAFLTVLSGFFHERTQYPEIKIRKKDGDKIDSEIYIINETIDGEEKGEV